MSKIELPLHLVSDRNWVGDFEDENGMYTNSCSSCKLDFVGWKYRRICYVCATKKRVSAFDFEKFKEYVNTYDPERDAGNKPDIVFMDMLYGLGYSIDTAFRYLRGFSNFQEFLVDRFQKKDGE